MSVDSSTSNSAEYDVEWKVVSREGGPLDFLTEYEPGPWLEHWATANAPDGTYVIIAARTWLGLRWKAWRAAREFGCTRARLHVSATSVARSLERKRR